jgi:type II secretory pathway pseudopilin PulG
MGEILVVVAIIAVLAATVIPTIKERMRTGYTNALAGELGNLAQGIQNYKATVGRYPLRLDYLDALPAGATDICGGTLLTPQRNAYVGPYITRVILSTTTWYVIADDDSVDNILWKNPSPVAGAPDVVWIDVLGVNPTTANDLDLLIDGVVGNGSGTLQYSNEASGDKDLKYMVPRKGC